MQIAKLFGAKVVGLAGTDDKCGHVKSKFDADHVLNYKSATLKADLTALAPFHGFEARSRGLPSPSTTRV